MDININYGREGNVKPLILTEPIDLLFQEVELGIRIMRNEIWNMPEGIDIQQYVLNKFVSVFQMRTEIKSFIERQCTNAANFVWDLNVYISEQNIIVINFKVNFENDIVTNQFFIRP